MPQRNFKKNITNSEQNKLLEDDILSFKRIAHQIDYALIMISVGGKIEWVNEYFFSLYGYTLDEYFKKRGHQFFADSVNDPYHSHISNCLKEKKSIAVEAIKKKKNGDKVWVHTSLTPILDDENEVTHLVAIESDISKHKEAEALLYQKSIESSEKSEVLRLKNRELERLSIVAKNTENAVMITDAPGNVLWVNSYFTKLYGYDLDAFIQKRGRNFRTTSFSEEVEKYIDRCIRTKSSVNYEALNISAQGEEIWTQTTLSPVLNENEEIVYLVTIDTDISKRKLFERKVMEQNREIHQSMTYALTIQQALFPSEELLTELFSNYFILNLPKSTISGDFYYARKVFDKIIFGAFDCTGHGIPGAIMSMLGVSTLNEITNSEENINTALILNRLRSTIIDSLHQNESNIQSKDGMDGTICIYDPVNSTLQYSGAYNSLVIVRNGEIIEYKVDRMPIGIHPKVNKDFKSDTIILQPDDLIYLYSDGFYSQFGGTKNKKFGRRNFFNLIQAQSSKTFSQQKEHLNRSFQKWKDEYEQIDDILVFSLKI